MGWEGLPYWPLANKIVVKVTHMAHATSMFIMPKLASSGGAYKSEIGDSVKIKTNTIVTLL